MEMTLRVRDDETLKTVSIPRPRSLETRTGRGFPHSHSNCGCWCPISQNAESRQNRGLFQIPAQNPFLLIRRRRGLPPWPVSPFGGHLPRAKICRLFHETWAHIKTSTAPLARRSTCCFFSHSWCRGLATNLHAPGIPDKEIQAILRHSNIAVTQSCYIKALTESQVSAMELVGEEFENGRIN